jgi:hypothetical protein
LETTIVERPSTSLDTAPKGKSKTKQQPKFNMTKYDDPEPISIPTIFPSGRVHGCHCDVAS